MAKKTVTAAKKRAGPRKQAEQAKAAAGDEVKAVMVRMTNDERRRLKLLAVHHDRTVQSLMTEAIDDLLAKYEWYE